MLIKSLKTIAHSRLLIHIGRPEIALTHVSFQLGVDSLNML